MKKLCLACSVAALLAACASENSPSSTTTSTGENELNAMDVKCRAEVELGSSFDLTPVTKDGTTYLEGTLTSEDGLVTVYTCRPVLRKDAADAGTSESLATCAPIDPKKTSSVELVRDNEKGVVNALVGDATSIPCAAVSISAIVPSYTTVEPYIHRACAGCHFDKFDSLEKVKAQQAIMLGLISSGAMPRRDPTWRGSAEGKAVLAFLAKSHELK